MRRFLGQVMWEKGKGVSMLSLSAPFLLQFYMFTNPEALQTLSIWVFRFTFYMGMAD